MKELYYVTSNLHKVRSLQKALSEFGIEVKQINMELLEPQSHDIREIAIEKAKYAFMKTGKACVIQDSGFYVDSLNGFPGTLVKYIIQTVDVEGILKLAEGKARECEFRQCFAYIAEGMKQPVLFEQVVKGRLAESPRGDEMDQNWSRLHLIFMPENTDKTLAEMSLEERNEWDKGNSHQYERDLGEYLNNR